MRRILSLVAVAAGAAFLSPAVADAVVRIDIDLSAQRMHVAADSGEAYDWPISSGRKGHLTPDGDFRPIALYPMAHSLKYDNAPMPHAIFFLPDYAIHGTDAVGSLGHPASHGCVRLAPGNAAVLYDMVRSEGATIHIRGDIGRYAPRAMRRRREAAPDEFDLDEAPDYRLKAFPGWDLEPPDSY